MRQKGIAFFMTHRRRCTEGADAVVPSIDRLSKIAWCIAFAVALQVAAYAQTPSAWVIGGTSGEPWAAPVQSWIALDDSTRPGALQLHQIPPNQNVLRERVRLSAQIPRNIFEYNWAFGRGRFAMEANSLVIGWNPRLWQKGTAEAAGVRALVDGDELTPAFTLNPAAGGKPSAETWFTLDIGVPLAIDSLVFFPPQNGLTSNNQRLRDLFLEAYEVSRTNQAVDWLLFEDETASTGSASYHPLDEILASTFSNNQSIVELKMPLRFTRFLRLRMGGVTTTGILAEIKAFGKGFPAEGRYESLPHFFGQPVSLGAINWKFTKYRMDASGQVYEDPTAPVQLAIHTRAGADSDPQAYFIYDELGRQIEVDREGYFDAEAPLDFEAGLPAHRAAITDDIGNWNAWSIIYQQSGDEIRSSDGREYLQFRFEITTQDPFAFGVLDSLAFEISPLLADSVVAEVSLEGQTLAAGDLIEVPLGVDTVFVYDLRTTFLDGQKSGFDGLDLDVPPETRFLDLEINGSLAVEGEDFSLLPNEDDRLSFSFPERFTDDTSFRVRFRSAIFQPSVFMGGSVLDRDPASTVLPQSIEPGDARADVSSDRIQVVSSQMRLSVLGDLRLMPSAFTPNGDGINDQTIVDFSVFGVQEALIRVEIFDLSGRLVATLRGDGAGAGRYHPVWNGEAEGGERVPPGLYLVKVEVDVDKDVFSEIRTVAVVY
jgi:hypothetical protein